MCLSLDKPTLSLCDRLEFVAEPELLWEVACFGLSSDTPEVNRGKRIQMYVYVHVPVYVRADSLLYFDT